MQAHVKVCLMSEYSQLILWELLVELSLINPIFQDLYAEILLLICQLDNVCCLMFCA